MTPLKDLTLAKASPMDKPNIRKRKMCTLFRENHGKRGI